MKDLKVLYLCDKQKEDCEKTNCSEEFCHHTSDVSHAINFKKIVDTASGEVVGYAEKESGWIPIKTRPLTEEEKQNAIEEHGIDPDDLEYPFAWHFDCKLPEPKEGEYSVDVLVTTDLGFVKATNFFIDYLGCSCFEEMDEADEFVAWMPLPEGYKKEVQDD